MLRIMDVLRHGVSNLCVYVLASSSDSRSLCRQSGSEGDCIVTPTSSGSEASESCGSEHEKKKKSSRLLLVVRSLALMFSLCHESSRAVVSSVRGQGIWKGHVMPRRSCRLD